ncbi:MAG: hypothetical protein M0R47_16835 [Methylobacter sp.]|uniref:hypothetical protein n=1 Tax=Methylobacter sp. TaxID=2051955 RepID=UPI0025EADD5E|nr:hypothetical protein [Methylobacter sp.]MCK9622189.1 hypothetical protein [Methylobacter sp.]
MITTFMPGISLIKNRLIEKAVAFTTIDAFENVVIGGDIEADLLPACLIGDAGSLLNESSKWSNEYAKTGDYFIMVLVENGANSHATSNTLITDSINALLYDDTDPFNPQWIPDGYTMPLELSAQQPPPIRDVTRTARTIIFTMLEAIS